MTESKMVAKECDCWFILLAEIRLLSCCESIGHVNQAKHLLFLYIVLCASFWIQNNQNMRQVSKHETGSGWCLYCFQRYMKHETGSGWCLYCFQRYMKHETGSGWCLYCFQRYILVRSRGAGKFLHSIVHPFYIHLLTL